jgi:hypothetical protein
MSPPKKHPTFVILDARDQRAEGPMHLINAPKALKRARSAAPNRLFPKSQVTVYSIRLQPVAGLTCDSAGRNARGKQRSSL